MIIIKDDAKAGIYFWTKNTVDPLTFGVAGNNKHINPLSSVNASNPVLYYTYNGSGGAINQKGINLLAGWVYGQNDALHPVYRDRFINVTNIGSQMLG